MSLAAVCLPARWPPVTDLAQHVAQARLLSDVLANPEGLWRVQWATPYWTATAIISALRAVLPFEWLARAVVLALLWGWAAALFLLLRRRLRSPELLLLVLPLLFNRVLMWGFLPFGAGFVGFVWWLLLVEAAVATPADLPRPSGRLLLQLFLCSVLLYFSHALWWVAAALWLSGRGLWSVRPARRWAALAACLLPTALLAAWWYPQLQRLGFDTPPVWATTPLQRLAPTALVDAMLGTLRGPAEATYGAMVVAWCAWGAWSNRHDLRAAADPVLLVAGAALTLAALLLPDKLDNTVEFARRWAPFGAMLAVMGWPVPRWPGRWRTGIAALAALVVLPATGAAWYGFDRDEMAGLSDALAALPDNQRLLCLDFVRNSPRLRHQPYMQMGAWGQARRGGTLSFSFAEMAPMPVILRDLSQPPWTPGLEWYPQKLRRRDLRWFDYALIHASPRIHAALRQGGGLAEVTGNAPWRLLRVERPAALPGAVTSSDRAGR